MFQNRVELLALTLAIAGGAVMILVPVLVIDSGYSLVYGSTPSMIDIQNFQETITAWITGGVIAVAAGSVLATFPRLRLSASGFLIFAALTYWSGFFNEPFLFIVRDLMLFSWPPVLVVSSSALCWVSRAERPISRPFWLSFIGGFLMLSLALPPLVYFGSPIKALSPYWFLGISSMVFGGIVTLLVSLTLAVAPSANKLAGGLSISGLSYYLLGLVLLLMESGNSTSRLSGSTLSVFAPVALLVSAPAVAARLIIFRAPRGKR